MGDAGTSCGYANNKTKCGAETARMVYMRGVTVFIINNVGRYIRQKLARESIVEIGRFISCMWKAPVRTNTITMEIALFI